jgi:uncharacterized protein
MPPAPAPDLRRLPSGRWRSIASGAWVAILLSIATGCASAGTRLPMRPAPETLPIGSPLRLSTLSDGDAWLRHHMTVGAYGEARTLLARPRLYAGADRLLVTLQEALVLRAEGDLARSNALLEWADLEAERRYVRSVSESVGSLIVNDRVVSYTPTSTELAMIPYYRMMNFLGSGDVDAAAVEARRIGAVLERGDRGPARRCGEDGMLQYLSGLVFEAAGERNDALVALRRADRAFGECPGGRTAAPAAFGSDLLRVAVSLGIEEVADSTMHHYTSAASAPSRSDSGEVLVIIERGFVAHLSEGAIHVPIFDEEVDRLESGDAAAIAESAAAIAARLVGNAAERAYWGRTWDDHPAARFGYVASGTYLLRLAWPAAHRSATPPAEMRLTVGTGAVALDPATDLSALMAIEADERWTGAMTRTVTRGLIRFLATREMEKKAEKQGGELLGFVTGRLANLAGNELERADTRSWSLLPDQIFVGRLTLPAGTHRVILEVDHARGVGETATLDLGEVTVEAGGFVLVDQRIWSDTLLARRDGTSTGSVDGWGGTPEPSEAPVPHESSAPDREPVRGPTSTPPH